MDFSDDLFMLPMTMSMGGGPEDFTVLLMKDYASVKPDLFKKAFILVEDTVISDTTITSVSEIKISPKDILALNGPAVEKILRELPKTHPLVKMVYTQPPDIKTIDEIVPQQVVFLSFFNQLFFLGTADKQIKVPFSGSFKDKFNEVRGFYEDKSVDSYKDDLPSYFEKIQKDYVDSSKHQKYDDFRGTLIAGIRGVVGYVQKGVIDTNANTVAGYENIEADYTGENDIDIDRNENYSDEEKLELQRQIDEFAKEKAAVETSLKETKSKLAKTEKELTKAREEITEAKTEKTRLLEELKHLPGQGKGKDKGDIGLFVASEEKKVLEKELAEAKEKLAKQKDYSEIKEDLKKAMAENETLRKERDELKLALAKGPTAKPPKQIQLGTNQEGNELLINDDVLVHWNSNTTKEATHQGKVRGKSKKNSTKFVVQEFKDGKPVLRPDGKQQFMRPVAKEDIKKYSKTLRKPRVTTEPLGKNKDGKEPLGKDKEGTELYKDDAVTVDEPGNPEPLTGKVRGHSKSDPTKFLVQILKSDGKPALTPIGTPKWLAVSNDQIKKV
jgi:hypothetical protein